MDRKHKRIHLDTDFGGDIDDLCALALLLSWPGAEITGITTVAENDGKRAGQVRYTLGLAERHDIPVMAGADVSGGFYPMFLGLPPEEKYWPEPIVPVSNTLDEALGALKDSIDQGAAVVAIGPLTNLYLLDVKYPGVLKNIEVCFMGGYIHPPRPGFPQWTNEHDFNKQVDIRSARHVLMNSKVTLVQVSVTAETFLRSAHVDRLNESGPLGRLIARQATAWAEDERLSEKYKDCYNVPDDIINFQYDPLACAIALGWNEGVEIKEMLLAVEEGDNLLHERTDSTGKLFRVVTRVDGTRFSEFWVDQVAF